RAALTAGVPPALSVAVARAESSLNPAARSPDGKSSGTFQVTPTTAAEMHRKFASGVVARPAGTDDVALGVGYLRYLDDLFRRGGRLGGGMAAVPLADPAERQLFAVAAFNAGGGGGGRGGGGGGGGGGRGGGGRRGAGGGPGGGGGRVRGWARGAGARGRAR